MCGATGRPQCWANVDWGRPECSWEGSNCRSLATIGEAIPNRKRLVADRPQQRHDSLRSKDGYPTEHPLTLPIVEHIGEPDLRGLKYGRESGMMDV